MRRLAIFILLFTFTTSYGQCTWNDIFPFELGSTKFDVMRIVSSNSTIEQPPDKYGIDKINNGLKYYDYLKDSVYINVVNLKFVKNQCIIDDFGIPINLNDNNHVQLTFSDDKLHKTKIEIEFKPDVYDFMMSNYERLLKLVPEQYKFEAPYDITHRETKEKLGEGISFTKITREEQVKLNYIDVGYIINYSLVYDKVNKEWYRSNEIEGYTLSISLVDLSESRLTRQGY